MAHKPSADSTPSSALRRAWRTKGWRARLLTPVAVVYGLLVAVRRQAYARGWLRSEHPGRPVIVVGNVIAGGAGKTPIVMAVVRHLQAQGWRPGIISRGYGRRSQDCRPVLPDSPAAEVGDEPALLARQCQVPVFVARQRIDAARALLRAHPDTDILVCDDGLQHLALQRDLELCVFNDEGMGNGWLLPAGPLREPWPRRVDAVLHVGPATAIPATGAPSFAIHRQLAPYALRADGTRMPLAALAGQPLHALAAIARPEDFFASLHAAGLTLARTTPLPDHYDFDSNKMIWDARQVLVFTEKDATKLWPHLPNALAVPLQVQIAPGFFHWLDQRLALSSSPA